MNSFGFRAVTFTLVMLGLITLGFNGVFQLVDVKYGLCESHYNRYILKPVLPQFYCLFAKFKPCGDFTEHRNMVQHMQMYDCLCADPQANVGKLREYTSQHLKSDLGTDADRICLQRPRNNSM